MKKAIVFLILITLVSFALLAPTFIPASSSDSRVEVSVSAGTGSRAIGKVMSDAGVAESSYAFRLACFLSGCTAGIGLCIPPVADRGLDPPAAERGLSTFPVRTGCSVPRRSARPLRNAASVVCAILVP